MYLILLLVAAFILFIIAIKIAIWYEKMHKKYVNWKEWKHDDRINQQRIKRKSYDFRLKISKDTFLVNVGGRSIDHSAFNTIENGRSAIFDHKDKSITSFKFKYVDILADKCIVAQSIKTAKWGVYTVKRDTIIEEKYDSIKAGEINGAIYYIATFNKKQCIINEKGNITTKFYDKIIFEEPPCDWFFIYNGKFLKNTAIFIIQENNKYGLLSSDFEIVIPIEQEKIHILESLTFIVQSNNKESIKYALYDREGKVLLPYHSDKLEILSANLIRRNCSNGVYILNNYGIQISNVAYKKIESNYSSILSSPFYNAYSSNGKCGYYDDKWKEILPCIYDCIKFPRIKDNIIAASMSGKFGIVNFENEALTEFIYDTAENAQKALFQIQKNYSQKQTKEKVVTDSYNIYESKEWKNKRDKILKRDNYTCQCCHCNNPSLGHVVVEKGEYIEVHSYDMYTGNYHIGSEKYLIDLDINLGYGKKIVMPILNVHHKLYIIDHEIWEYANDDLITLCQKCHQLLHSSEEIEIPIVKEIAKGHFVKTGRCTTKPIPKPFNSREIETFPAWSVVEEKNHRYEFVEKIVPSYSVIYIENANFNKEKCQEYATIIMKDFIQDSLQYTSGIENQ